MEVERAIRHSGAHSIKGQVPFISTTAEFTPNTVDFAKVRTALVYRIRILADDPDGVLRQGMPMTVSVVTSARGVETSGGTR